MRLDAASILLIFLGASGIMVCRMQRKTFSAILQ
jgi:hypothetical protein